MKQKNIYQHFGSATISLAELNDYERLIRRQLHRGRAIKRRKMWMR